MLTESCHTQSPQLPEDKQPINILWIVSDSLRMDILGCYGGPANTPNIDRLARDGTLFMNAYSTAPCTLPSSVSMLTGNYARIYTHYLKKPATHSKTKNTKQYCFFVPDTELLTAEQMKREGALCIASIENQVVKRSNILQGFDIVPDDQVTRLVSNIPHNRRFLLLKWFMDPHAPYSPPENYLRKIDIQWDDLPRTREFYTQTVYGAFSPLMKKGEISEAELFVFNRLYQAEVEWLDERVGCLLRELEKRPDSDKTLVIFTSDHGELIGQHNRIGHSLDFWEPLVRVPLIFRGPGIPKGEKILSIVTHLDLTPTIRSILSISGYQSQQGESFLNSFLGKEITERSPFFDCAANKLTSRWLNTSALLTGGFKLIVNPGGMGGRWSLYSTLEDSAEKKDISKEYPQKLQVISTKWHKIWKVNREKLLKNMRRLAERKNDLTQHHKETLKILKSLGYL